MLTIGTPQDNPAAGTVLVTSGVVTTPRKYKVKVVVVAETSTWVQLAHRATGGGLRTSVLLPVNTILGPADVYEAYFANLDYVDLSIREGLNATGTVQATVELI